MSNELASNVPSTRTPALWAAVGVLCGASMVGLAWSLLGGQAAPAPIAKDAGEPKESGQPVIIVNLPPTTINASDMAPSAVGPSPLPSPAASPTVTPAVIPPEVTPAQPVANNPAPTPSPTTPLTSKRINLNTATAEELDLLPGVGRATALAIIEYRTKAGRFRVVSDLDKVPGIGPSKLEKLRPLVTVD